MTSYFTPKTEIMHKYNLEEYKIIAKSFMFFPLAAFIQDKAFCCHFDISLDEID